MIIKYSYFFGGLLISCIGNYFLIAAQNLGVSPWDVFHLGISRFFPSIGLGTIGIIVGLFLLILAFFMGIKPRAGTFLNIYYYGFVINALMKSHLLEIPQSLALTLAYLIIGILISGFGTALYLHANAGAGPRDSLMLGLHKKTQLSIAKVRSGIEVAVVVLGFFLGGPLGIGTLIYSLTIGISVQWAMGLIKLYDMRIHSNSI
jgi:uncharacterized protein